MTEDDLQAIEARLRDLPRGPWYIENARPGRDDEARVYDGNHYGVCKPTPNNQHYRRPIAEFVVAARSDIPALVAEVRRLQGHIHDDDRIYEITADVSKLTGA
jgi:hypothetical protein